MNQIGIYIIEVLFGPHIGWKYVGQGNISELAGWKLSNNQI